MGKFLEVSGYVYGIERGDDFFILFRLYALNIYTTLCMLISLNKMFVKKKENSFCNKRQSKALYNEKGSSQGI